jgi:transposase-like protein
MSLEKKVNQGRGRFEKSVIREVVCQVELGVSRKKLLEQYGINGTTLISWLRDYGSASYHASKRISISSVEKRSLLLAIVQGRMTVSEAKQSYNIKQEKTIRDWLRIFKKENGGLLIADQGKMKEKKPTVSEGDEIKALKKALAESQLKVIALETLVDVAERELKIDIRKKSGAKQSPK